MIQYSCRHPQGTIVMVTGELTRYAKTMQDLAMLLVPRGTGIAWHAGPAVKKNVDFGFQFVANDPNSSWAWIMGDDHSFHPRTLLNLLDHEVDVVAPLCMTRAPEFTTSLWRKGRNVRLAELPDVDLYKLVDDETYGDAGLLLRKRVIAKTGPPWQDDIKCGSFTVEDRIFANKVRKAGFDFHVDLGTAIGHITPCEIIPEKGPDGWKTILKFGGKAHNG